MSLDQFTFNRILEMAKIEIPFVGPAYKMRATQLDAQDCINWYLTGDPTGKFQKALLDRPGLTLFLDGANNKQVRGFFQLKNVVFTVIGNEFYAFYRNGSKILLGNLKTFLGRVSITANNFQIFITDGSSGYIYQMLDNAARKADEFFEIENASSIIGDPDFFGTGLDDVSVSGPYIGEISKTYKIQIDSVGPQDTFKWSDDGGITYAQTKVNITGANQELNDGLQISFLNITGHVLDDFWAIVVTIGSAFYPPILATYQDGYGIYVRQNTNRFYISALNDFSQVNALDYASANIYPDKLITSISIHEELWMIGKQTTEIYYNTGNPEFPFEPRTNLIINYGTEAPWSVKTGADNVIFMLAKNRDGGRLIVRIANYDVQMISTEPLNEELNSYEKVDDAFAMLMEINGHLFYLITIPFHDKTWVCDITLKAWHEWKSDRSNPLPQAFPYTWGMFRGNNHVVFDGKHLIGDSITGKIFYLDSTNAYDYDVIIKRQRTCQHFQQNLSYQTVNSLQIDVESGMGLTDGQGEDPQLMLQVSRDGGKTYGAEMWRSAGKIGKYPNRALWRRLGTDRVFTYRLQKTDPTKMAILGAIADIEVGD